MSTAHICALQACIDVLQVAAIKSVVSETDRQCPDRHGRLGMDESRQHHGPSGSFRLSSWCVGFKAGFRIWVAPLDYALHRVVGKAQQLFANLVSMCQVLLCRHWSTHDTQHFCNSRCVIASVPQTSHLLLGFLCLWAVVTVTGLAPLTMVDFNCGLWRCWWHVPLGGVVFLVGFSRVASGPMKMVQHHALTYFYKSRSLP